MTRVYRILVVLAALMGADGVILAAATAHQADATRLAAASSMLLFHATAVLASVALAERGLIHVRVGLGATFGFVIAASLFAGDLTLRQYAGHGLKDADQDELKTLDKSAVSYQVVLTKSDQVKPAELQARIAETMAALAKHPAAFPEVLVTSSRSGEGMPELRAAMVRLLEERGQ